MSAFPPLNRVLGSDLHPDNRRYVLAAFVHRNTGENRPDWVRGKYPLQFANDSDWLANTRFATRSDGRIDRRVKQCFSSPTWPHNPELRGARS